MFRTVKKMQNSGLEIVAGLTPPPLIASLSHLEALCLNVTSDALNNCLF